MEIERIQTLERLSHFVDFFREGIAAITKRDKEKLDADKVLKAFRAHVYDENYGIFVECSDEGVPRGFLVAVCTCGFFDEREGVLWLVYFRGVADRYSIARIAEEWFRTMNVSEVYAVDKAMCISKMRAFAKWQFKPNYIGYRRTL